MTTTHRVISYTYDSLYRLITATYSSGEYYHYTYDPVGNRQSLTTHVDVVNYQYDAANRLTSVNGQTYNWDNNGNLLSDGLRTYTYDHANRLTQVVSGTLTTQFTYNGAGDRVAKTVDGLTTDYVLDPAAGLTQVLQETTTGQATSYLYGHDLLAQYDSGTWAYHVNDGLGSVRQLADPTGQVVQGYSFSPFGVPLGESGGEPYGYTGEQWDSDAALLYLQARWYVPGTGRFLTQDLWTGDWKRPASLHRYSYSNNNPTKYVDPSGFQPEDTSDPYDPGWCDDWEFPRKIICKIITGERTPNWLRYTYMYNVYTEIVLGLRYAGSLMGGTYSFKHAPDFWSHFIHGHSVLGSGDYVELKGPDWGDWARTHEHHEAMHDRQVEDFFREEVWPAAQRCQTKVGPWQVRRDRYPYLEAGHANNDVTVSIGRHYIEGNFYAENIRFNDYSVTADVMIERFINDIFDFVNDTGDIPLKQIIPPKWNRFVGYGTVPNVWAQTLIDKGWAHDFDIHIEWEERFTRTWKRQ